MPSGRSAAGERITTMRMSVLRSLSVTIMAAGMALGCLLPAACAEQEPTPYDRFIRHLRANFEDIHEVSMRFHMSDPSIGGLIVLEMVWVDGRLDSARAVENETGSDDEVAALIEAMRGWTIADLPGRHEITTSLRIKLVGSDDPRFPESAILTGSVRDIGGEPLAGAAISLVRHDGSEGEIPARCNREGIFVRTLIPPGIWDLTVRHEDHEPATVLAIELQAGQHRIEHVVLE